MSRIPSSQPSFWPSSAPTKSPLPRRGRGTTRRHVQVAEEVDVDVDVQTEATQRQELQQQMYGVTALNGGVLQNLFPPVGAGIRSDLALSQSQGILHGSPLGVVSPFLLSRYNGFGCNLSQNPYAMNQPGSFYGQNFKDGNFFVSCLPATAAPNSYRLLNPQFINDTNARATTINGVVHRILILIAGVTYTFSFDQCIGGACASDGLSLRNFGWYFTFDSVGGNMRSKVNRQTDECCELTVASAGACCGDRGLPGILPETSVMGPGSTVVVTPNSNWGQLVYLASYAPFDVCPIIIVPNLASAACRT